MIEILWSIHVSPLVSPLTLTRIVIKIAILSAICLVLNFYIGQIFPLWIFSIGVFVIAWIGQFYGHKIEGKKPSFLKDLQFLLIGPAWVVENIFSNKR